jgi:hypothetical protein
LLTFNVLPKQTIFSTDLTLLPPPSSHDHDETMTTWQPSLTSSSINENHRWLSKLDPTGHAGCIDKYVLIKSSFMFQINFRYA